MNSSENGGISGCSDFEKCLEILHLMLDNESTVDQDIYFNTHIAKCMVCFERYEVEKQIKELLKTKLAKLPTPEGLADTIKARISQSA